MVTLRTPHAKNQPPRPKTVAYRRITDRQTHRQRKQTLRTPFSIFFLVFNSLLKEQSDYWKIWYKSYLGKIWVKCGLFRWHLGKVTKIAYDFLGVHTFTHAKNERGLPPLVSNVSSNLQTAISCFIPI